MNSQTEKEFLETYDISNYERPSLASDIVLLSLQRDKQDADIKRINVHALQLLLIKRASHPFKNKWALPGGFCRKTESVYETTKRELFEETNITNAYLKLSNIYSNQNRDPRGWIISNAWLGLIDRYQCSLRADTDAWEAAWFTIKSLTSNIIADTDDSTEYLHELVIENENTSETLCLSVTETITFNNNVRENKFNIKNSDIGFDHAEIIMQTLLNFKEDIKIDIRPLFNLLPPLFTLGEAQTAYELIIGEKSQNFRRTISEYVIETDAFAETRGFRPTKLFVKNNKMFKCKYR